MTQTKRFLFDECIGKPLMLRLQNQVLSSCEFVYLCDFFSQGTNDNEWLPEIAKVGGHIVITTDGGKYSRSGDKLPELCEEYGVTHVVIGPSLHRKKGIEKIAALTLIWNEIECLHDKPPGSRFNLRIKESKVTTNFSIKLEPATAKAKKPKAEKPKRN